MPDLPSPGPGRPDAPVAPTHAGEAAADTPSAGHIPVLDGIRGLAILLVLVFHFARFSKLGGGNGLDRMVARFTEAGWVGVDLFFVLSGFLITGILYDSRERTEYYTRFYLRRCLRIFPLYYATLAFLIFVFPHLPGYVAEEYRSLGSTQWWFWSYSQNVLFGLRGFDAAPKPVGHLWSLAIEEQFYLLWPVIVHRCSRPALLRIATIAVVVALACRLLLLANGEPVAAYTLTPARLDGLAAGAFVALLARGPGGLMAWRGRAAHAGIGAGLVLVGLAVLDGGQFRFEDPLVQTLGYTALAIGFAAGLLLVLTSAPATRPVRFLSHPVMRFWGRYSYGLYVVHHLLGWQLQHAGLTALGFPLLGGSRLPGAALAMGLMTAASISVALVSWRVLEEPALRLKRRFAL